MIWICIPVYNRVERTLNILKCIYSQTYKFFKVVICNDGSTDSTVTDIEKMFNDVILLHGDGNLWWGGAMNHCLNYVLEHASQDDYVIMMNNDIYFEQDFLFKLIGLIEPNEVLAVIAKNSEDMSIIYAGERINKITAKSTNLSRYYNDNWPVKWDVDLHNGRATLIPLTMIKENGLIDIKHFIHYGGDAELSVRMKQNGVELRVTNATHIFSYQEETSIGSIYRQTPLGDLLKSFFLFNSPNYYRSRYFFAKRYTYKYWVWPFYFMVYLRILAGSIKRNKVSIWKKLLFQF